jgi:hypothetical protein
MPSSLGLPPPLVPTLSTAQSATSRPSPPRAPSRQHLLNSHLFVPVISNPVLAIHNRGWWLPYCRLSFVVVFLMSSRDLWSCKRNDRVLVKKRFTDGRVWETHKRPSIREGTQWMKTMDTAWNQLTIVHFVQDEILLTHHRNITASNVRPSKHTRESTVIL